MINEINYINKIIHIKFHKQIKKNRIHFSLHMFDNEGGNSPLVSLGDVEYVRFLKLYFFYSLSVSSKLSFIILSSTASEI